MGCVLCAVEGEGQFRVRAPDDLGNFDVAPPLWRRGGVWSCTTHQPPHQEGVGNALPLQRKPPHPRGATFLKREPGVTRLGHRGGGRFREIF